VLQGGGAPRLVVAVAARKTGQRGSKRRLGRRSPVYALLSTSIFDADETFHQTAAVRRGADADADADADGDETSHQTAAALGRAAMKVFAVSDIHTDYPENLEWVKSLTKEEFGGDALIVAGDVSDDEKTFIETFRHLSRTFRHVFFVAGNHELYLRKGTRRAGEEKGDEGRGEEGAEQEAPASSGCLRPGDGGGDEAGPLSLPRPLRKYRDSVEKLAAITADLAALGVRTTPTLLDGAEVVFSGQKVGVGGGAGGAPAAGGGRGRGGASDDRGGEEDDDEKQKTREQKKKKKKTSTPIWIVSCFLFRSNGKEERGEVLRNGKKKCSHTFLREKKKNLDDDGRKKKQPFSFLLPIQVPILSWYCASFDTEPPIPTFNADPRRIYTDFKACRWPPDLDPLALNDGGDALAAFFDSLNDPQLASLARSLGSDDDAGEERSPRPVVLSFSHFLPFLELLPEKRFVTAPNLASVAGSEPLGRRVASLRPDVHVFGHTHIPFDGGLPSIGALAGAAEGREGEGGAGGGKRAPMAKTLPTRFVQAPLKYPAERRRSREGKGGSGSPTRSSRSYELQLIWDCGGGESESEEGDEEEEEKEGPHRQKIVVTRGKPGPTRSAFWTEYYENNARDPSNLELAPWVRPRVERYRNL